MEPIGLTVKQRQNKYGSRCSGELMLIHHCEVCDKFSINRIAADDISDKLLEIYQTSVEMDATIRCKLEACGIQVLQGDDHQVVMRQLWGGIWN
jgi:hypothetical protein